LPVAMTAMTDAEQLGPLLGPQSIVPS